MTKFYYEVFQIENISSIIKTENPVSILEDDASIDEKSVSDIFNTRYTNYKTLKYLKDMFGSIFKKHVMYKDKNGISILDKSIQSILSSLKYVSNQGKNGYALLSNFKSASDMLVIKTAKNNNNSILLEYFIGAYGTNKLRYEIPNFSYILGIFKCNNLSESRPGIISSSLCSRTYDPKDEKTQDSESYYVLYEKIEGITLAKYIASMNTEEDYEFFISYILQIALSLEIAQRKIDFVHYDLHPDNIILRKLNGVENIQYNIDDVSYSVKTNAIATIIDYGMSRISKDGLYYGSSMIFEEFGIETWKFQRGYDIYKLMFFCFNDIYFRNPKLVKKFFEILDYFKNIDIYKIVSSRDDDDKLYRALRNSSKKFHSLYKKNTKFDFTPIDFVSYIINMRSFSDNIKIINRLYKDKIVMGFSSLIKTNEIYKKPFIFGGDYSEIKDGFNSFILNSYTVRVLNIANSIYNLDSVDTIIDSINKINRENETSLKNNDNVLLESIIKKIAHSYSKISKEAFNYIDSVNINSFNFKIHLNFSAEMNSIKKFTASYDEFIKLENYSIYAFQEFLQIDERYKKEYYRLKNKCVFVESIKVSSIASMMISSTTRLSGSLKKDDETRVDTIKLVNKSMDTMSYYVSCPGLEKIDNVLSHMRKDFLEKGIPVYTYPRNKNQIKYAFTYKGNFLISLLKKYLNKIGDEELKNIVQGYIAEKRNDIYIYEDLRKIRRSDVRDFDKRADSRVKHLDSFAKNIINEHLDKTSSHNYMDYGGSDGSIAQSIGRRLGLDRDRIYSVDVEQWAGGKNGGDKEVTYVTIEKDEKLPFVDSYFSTVTSFMVFHHIFNIECKLMELRRVMKNGGLLFIREHDAIDDVTRILIDIEHTLYESLTVDRTNIEFFSNYIAYYKSKNEWIELLKIYGFKPIADSFTHSTGKSRIFTSHRDNIRNPTNTYYEVFVLEK